ncbi:TcaA 3rd/4th domain-containing protein [Virgibacillus sp. MG-45]|uniref:TcaA 3rd/4th domain-containing protein n=1 Tax=Virgibacillus sp. MG-45 TaxID=3102791 RepID=UPI002EDAC56F
MKCDHCGHEIKQKEQHYCPECGSNLFAQHEQHSKKKTKRKRYYMMSTLFIVVITAFIVFFFIGKETFDPQAQIDAFKEAVQEENVGAALKMLTPSIDSLKIDEKNTAQFLAFLKENPDRLNVLVAQLEEQANALEKGKEINPNHQFATLNVVEKGKKWGAFTDYQFEVIPAFIRLSEWNNEVELDLYINNEKLETTPNQDEHHITYGPYMPGEYTIKGILERSFLKSEQKDKVELFQLDKNALEHKVNLEVSEISLHSTFLDEATLYVNDQKTDMIIKRGKQSIGPFPLGEDIPVHLEKELPWGIIKSEKAIITDGFINTRITRNSVITEDEREKVIGIINDVMLSYTDALNKRDVSVLHKNATDNLKKQVQEDIKFIKKEKPNYQGTLLQSQFNIPWEIIPEYNEDRKAYMFKLHAMFSYHEPKDKLWATFRDNEKRIYRRGQKMLVLFDEKEKQWMVDEVEKYHFFATDVDPVYKLN